MQLNDERLRLAYGSLLEGRTDGSRRSHPEPEALVALAERSGSEAVRLEVLDHVMTCDACRRELDLVRASLSAAGIASEKTASMPNGVATSACPEYESSPAKSRSPVDVLGRL